MSEANDSHELSAQKMGCGREKEAETHTFDRTCGRNPRSASQTTAFWQHLFVAPSGCSIALMHEQRDGFQPAVCAPKNFRWLYPLHLST